MIKENVYSKVLEFCKDFKTYDENTLLELHTIIKTSVNQLSEEDAKDTLIANIMNSTIERFLTPILVLKNKLDKYKNEESNT